MQRDGMMRVSSNTAAPSSSVQLMLLGPYAHPHHRSWSRCQSAAACTQVLSTALAEGPAHLVALLLGGPVELGHHYQHLAILGACRSGSRDQSVTRFTDKGCT